VETARQNTAVLGEESRYSDRDGNRNLSNTKKQRQLIKTAGTLISSIVIDDFSPGGKNIDIEQKAAKDI
jgi:hypothetical protein